MTFFTKTIHGVGGVAQGDADRDWRGDSLQERRLQEERKHLSFAGENGVVLRWDRESDQSTIENFMRSAEPSLALRDPTPLWRKAAAWFLLVFGLLVWDGGIGAFFPKSKVKV